MRWKLLYEIFMSILALISVIFIWADHPTWGLADKIIWGIFVIDVCIRWIRSEDKLTYFRKHPFDFIAIIPFDSIFRIARLARLIRLLALLSRLPIFKILKTNHLDKVLISLFLMIFLFSVPIKSIEPSIDTYEDALWWAVVTMTTVGYGDISPETSGGRLIALILMFSGIGLIGMVTSSIATFFIGKTKKEDAAIVFIKNQLDRMEELSPKEIDTLILLLEQRKKEKGNSS